MTITVETLLNSVVTPAVVDTAAMVTLVREDYFKTISFQGELGPTCILTGISEDPLSGQIIHNVPITIGTQTFLHSVCVAPINDLCLLGLDFLKVTESIIDLSNDMLDIEGEKVPIKTVNSQVLQVSKIVVVRRTVVQPQTISYVPVNLTKPIDGPYIVTVTPTGHRKVLLSNVYGEGKSVTLKFVNDSDSYVTFKKDKAVGLSEAISITEDHVTYRSKMQQQPNAAPCERECSELPEHLQTMYDKKYFWLVSRPTKCI